MKSLIKIAAASALAVMLAACNQTVSPGVASGSGLVFAVDGDCVTRNVSVFDRETGETVIAKQRFCGGRPVLAQ
jgi:hypothetical protein